MKRSALFLLLPLVAGCDVHSKNPANGEGSVSIQADQNGSVAFNLPFAKGSVKLPQSMMQGGNVDIDGVKLPPGSAVTGFNVNGGEHGALVNMSFTAPAPPEQVRSWFAGQFKDHGVQATVAGDTVAGKSKDGSPFTIQVSQAGSGSQGKIVIQAKD